MNTPLSSEVIMMFLPVCFSFFSVLFFLWQFVRVPPFDTKHTYDRLPVKTTAQKHSGF